MNRARRSGCGVRGVMPSADAGAKAGVRREIIAAGVALLALILPPLAALAQTRVGELTIHSGDVPRRLAGYGLVVGLDGTGDRSFGGFRSGTPTVRSVMNLLRRFDIEVPPDQLRLRNVAAVLITAEVSPYLRSGGRFEVQVAALGDAVSLRGGVLWITPLVADPGQPPVATAQGPILVATDGAPSVALARRGNSARIVQGGVLEVDPEPLAHGESRLLLKIPDLATAARIAVAVNAAFGAGTAKVADPGAVELTAARDSTRDLPTFLAAVDTLAVDAPEPARIVIDSRDGTVVAGASVRVGSAVVSHRGITLEIGDHAPMPGAPTSLVRVASRTSVADVATGLHAAGARPEDIAAIFEALERAGALTAEVVIR